MEIVRSEERWREPMATEAEILAETEELGRMTPEQEVLLYNIALRQEELGREPTHMLYEKMLENQDIMPLIERELLTYQLYNHGGSGAPKVVNLIVTLKGTRYCIIFGDEIHELRKVNAMGIHKDRQE